MFCRVSADALGALGVLEHRLPGVRGLVRVAGAHDREARDGAQRGQVLDRLVGGAVLAETDGVVGPHVDHRRLHQRREAHGRAHVVAEREERAAVGAGGPVQGDAVEDRAHRVLADAEVQGAPVGLGVPHLRGDRLRAERVGALHRGVVALGEVRRAAPQLGQHVGQRLEHLAGGLAGGDALRVGLPRRAAPSPSRSGRSRPSIRSSSSLRSGSRAAHDSYCAVHSSWASRPRSTTLRAWASTVVVDLEGLARGRSPRISLTARDLVVAERGAVRLAGVHACGRREADHGAQQDERRPVGLGAGVLQRLEDAGDVLAALDDLHVPAVGLVALRRCPRTARSWCRPRWRSCCRRRSP